MAHTIEVVEGSNYVCMTLLGEITLSEIEEARAAAAATLADSGLDRLLIDATQLHSTMSTGENYKFTSDHSTHFGLGLRTAIVHRPDQAEGFRFIENVAVNRGQKMQQFIDEDDAVAWLLDGQSV